MKTQPYYRVFDHQRGTHFATGYNSRSKGELLEDFKSYMEGAGESVGHIRSWNDVAASLGEVSLEKSKEPFEEKDQPGSGEQRLAINLPGFCGFYETELDDIYEVSDDLETSGDVLESEYESIDWAKVRREIGERYLLAFEAQNRLYLSEAGIKRLEYKGINSPREYNYTTDKLELFVEFDVKVFTAHVKEVAMSRAEAFRTYLEDNYQSRSGFSSFYSADEYVWLNEYPEKIAEDNVIFEGFLEFCMLHDMPDYNEQDIIDEVLHQKHEYLTFLEN